jgi:hypothetical protein
MNYIIKLNTPTAKWSPEMAEIFGNSNQGIPVAAPDKENAIEAFNCALPQGRRFNPFYLRITELK